MGIEAESKEEGQREESKDLFGIHGSTPSDQVYAMPRTYPIQSTQGQAS